MTDATICHDPQFDMWYIQRELHIEEIFPLTLEYLKDQQEENDRLRKLCASLYEFAMSEYPDGKELNFAYRMRELGIEVSE